MTATLIQELHTSRVSDKIQKPNFDTKAGRQFLAFYLSTKLKQIIAYDKKHEYNCIFAAGRDFLANFLKKIVDEPHNAIAIGIFGDDECVFGQKITECAAELELPVIVTRDFSALLDENKIVIVKCEPEMKEECKALLDIKIYAKKKKERLSEDEHACEIIVNSDCPKEYLKEILNYIKIITNDFAG